MKYNFDEIIPRAGTNSLKYDFARERGRPEDILPLWVADMDFQTPAEVIERLTALARHGIFGYTETKADYFEAVRSWFDCGFGYEPQPEWLVKTPGVVYALATAVRALTEPGQSVMIQEPVYYPFAGVVRANGRRLINNRLVCQNGRYRMDLADFERQIVEHQVRLFLLCSPHNPVARVWTREELTALGQICLKHHCPVVSDEIHCDFIYPGHQHHILAALGPELADNALICTAPSKTFNLAGLQTSNIFIQNQALRKRFVSEIQRSGYSQLNTMGLAACQCAYEQGRDWLEQLKIYLAQNLDFLRDFVARRLPGLRLVEPEGTYLVWLDFSGLGLGQADLTNLIVRRAKVWLDDGRMFGQGGDGFQRINIACPRSLLETALTRLARAI
ncbi:MAG: pyridoxal phosphate-dependent aminotransferase [Candidatus Adiutrix sp.]|jgi:cystathionine beta-lyase|nr:pyridoxal phosphate-dependent aminotransferase [Candidatus Adiutrix sp.]